MLRRLLIAASLLLALPGYGRSQDSDAQRGGELYDSRCGGCHSLTGNRIGPAHRGVYGRRAGSVADFDYSPALRAAAFVWNARMLDAWLADPQGLVPGQRMGYAVPDARDRADIIAYLRQAR